MLESGFISNTRLDLSRSIFVVERYYHLRTWNCDAFLYHLEKAQKNARGEGSSQLSCLLLLTLFHFVAMLTDVSDGKQTENSVREKMRCRSADKESTE